MAKFKVGQLVRILPRKSGQKYQHPEYTDEMADFPNNAAYTVYEVFGKDNIELLEDDYGWTWHEDWLTQAEMENV